MFFTGLLLCLYVIFIGFIYSIRFYTLLLLRRQQRQHYAIILMRKNIISGVRLYTTLFLILYFFFAYDNNMARDGNVDPRLQNVNTTRVGRQIMVFLPSKRQNGENQFFLNQSYGFTKTYKVIISEFVRQVITLCLQTPPPSSEGWGGGFGRQVGSGTDAAAYCDGHQPHADKNPETDATF